MSRKWSFDGRMGRALAAGTVLGAFLFAAPHAGQAKRLHDPKVETKVSVHQTIRQGETHNLTSMQAVGAEDFRARVQTILNPPKEEPASVEAPARDDVPMTESAYDDSILGTPLASPEQCVRYLLSQNPAPAISVSPEKLVSYYFEEGRREGIRPDVAFAQALKETGFFRYGGTVTADQNNYCGLGTTSAAIKGAYFPSSQLGVRAHIQHLLAYASTRKPMEPVVDPRYELVRGVYGTSTLHRWEDLNGRWAVPGDSYGQSILSMFRAMLRE